MIMESARGAHLDRRGVALVWRTTASLCTKGTTGTSSSGPGISLAALVIGSLAIDTPSIHGNGSRLARHARLAQHARLAGPYAMPPAARRE